MLLAIVCPRDTAGGARRQLAVDLIDDVTVFNRKSPRGGLLRAGKPQLLAVE